jgi:Protein of unknown function (DUF3606)
MEERERINIQDPSNLQQWCQRFECSERELMYCVGKVGTSVSSIESYLYMNRMLISKWNEASNRL